MDEVLNLIINATDNASNIVKNVGSTVTGLGNQLTSAGSSIRNFGGQMTLMTLPIAAFGKESIDAAEKVQGMKMKFNTVFSGMTTQVQNWASTTGDALGQSKYDLEGYASNLGNVFEHMGATTDASAKMSESTITLASNIAAFNHTDVASTIQSVQSAMEGRTMALKQYGIVISATDLKQEEMNMHLDPRHITDAEKAQATLNLVMAQSKNTMGDAAQAAQTFQGKGLALQNKIHDLQVEIGEKLMTILTPLIDKVGEVVKWFSNLDEGTKDTIVKIGLLAVAIGPILVILGTLISTVGSVITFLGGLATFIGGTLIPALLPVIVPIALIIGAIVLLKKAWDENLGGIQQKVQSFVELIRQAFQSFVSLIGNIINSGPVQFFITTMRDTLQNIIKNLQNAFVQIKPHIEALAAKFSEWGEKLRPIIEVMMKIVAVVLAVAGVIIGVLIMAIGKVIQIISSVLGPVIGFLIDLFSKVIDVVVNVASGIFNALKGVVDFIVNQVVPFIVNAFQSLFNFIKPILQELFDFFQTIWNDISIVIQVVFSVIKEIVRVAMDVIQNLIIPIIEILVKEFEIGFNAIRTVVETVFNFIKNNIIQPVINWFNDNIKPKIDSFIQGVIDIFNRVRGPVENVFNSVRNFLGSVVDSIRNTVLNTFNNLKDGISNIFNGVKDIITGIWNGIINGVKSGINGVINIINNFIKAINGTLDLINQVGKTIGVKVDFKVGEIPHLAKGGDFIVPPGYEKDNFLMAAQSGERVQVTPKNQVGKNNETKKVTNNNQKTVNLGGITIKNNEDFVRFIQVLNYNLT